MLAVNILSLNQHFFFTSSTNFFFSYIMTTKIKSGSVAPTKHKVAVQREEKLFIVKC